MKHLGFKNLLIIGAAALWLAVVGNVLFFGVRMGLNFPVFVILSLLTAGYLTWRIRRKEMRVDRESVVIVGLIVFFSIMVFVRASLLLTFFNVLGTALLLFILTDLSTGKRLSHYLALDYGRIFVLPFWFIPPFFETISEYIALRGLGTLSPVTKQVIRGTVMAIVALVVFTLLFATADPLFNALVRTIFSVQFNSEFVIRSVEIVISAAFFIGAFGYAFRARSKASFIHHEGKRSLGRLEVNILLTSITALFLVFIAFQLNYLFGGLSHLLASGLTYADYARKGFFELLLVAALSYLIIAFAEKQVEKSEDGHLRSFKTLSTILIAEVVLILVSAFARLSLYEQAYGFSTIRLYSYGLMILIGAVLVLMAQHILTDGDRAKFLLRAFSCVVLLLIAMNLLNPDAFIAQRNLERYKQTGKVDVQYLANLSYDAIPYTVTLLNDPNVTTRQQFAGALAYSSAYLDLHNPEAANWQSLVLMKARAAQLLAPYALFIEENKDTQP